MKNLKIFRREKGYTQKFMGEKLGMTQQGYASYENGKTSPDPTMLVKIARILCCSVDQLLNYDAPAKATAFSTKRLKLLTEHSDAAEDIFADEIELNSDFSPDNYFAMLITGESMHPYYMDGDLVIVRRQSTAETGDDTVIRIGQGAASVKRVHYSSLGVTLRDMNPAYENKLYSKEQTQMLPIQILGIIVELRRKI